MARITGFFPQLFDDNGDPLANYVVYFGESNVDPKLFPKVPYSDSGLQNDLSAAQTLDATGAFATEIFIGEAYSIQIDTPLGALFKTIPEFILASDTEQFSDWSAFVIYPITALVIRNDKFYKSQVGNNLNNDPATDTVNWNVFEADRTRLQEGMPLDDTDIDVSNILTTPGDGDSYDLSGSVNLEGITTIGVGSLIRIRFTSVRELIQSATFELISSADLTTGVGDIAEFYEFTAGSFRMLSYNRQSGQDISGLEFIGEVETSNTAFLTIDDALFPSMFDSTYSEIEVHIEFLHPVVNNNIYCEVSVASAFQSGGGAYGWQGSTLRGNGSPVDDGLASDTKMQLTHDPISSTAVKPTIGRIYLFNVNNTVRQFHYNALHAGHTASSGLYQTHCNGRYEGGTEAIDGIRWFAATDNLFMKVKVWGLRAQ